MNKQNLRDLKTAWSILDGTGYAPIANQLHIVIEQEENKEPKEIADLLFSGELIAAVKDGTLSKEKNYTYSIEKEHHGDYVLTIYEGEEEVGIYQWYTDDQDAKDDIEALELQGFTIEEN